jgi:V8-like Glu-specific endopeptidase
MPFKFTRALRALSLTLSRAAASPTPRRRPSVALTVEALEERAVPSLTPVSPSAGWPWTSIASVQITWPDGTQAVGSGAMVDSFHLLTAGHVVYNHSHGGWASSIQVIPEMSGDSQPFGIANMTYERTYNSWINYSNTHGPEDGSDAVRDIALVTLDSKIGDQTGWMSFGYNNDDNFFSSGTILNTAGYPADGGFDGSKMEFSSGPIAGLSDGGALQFRQSDITIFGGSSGSPIWAHWEDGTRIIYGVVQSNSDDMNYGTRITEQIFNDFVHDMQTDVAPDLVQPGIIHLNVLTPGLGGFSELARLDQVNAVNPIPFNQMEYSPLRAGDFLTNAAGDFAAANDNTFVAQTYNADLAANVGNYVLQAASPSFLSPGGPVFLGGFTQLALNGPTTAPLDMAKMENVPVLSYQAFDPGIFDASVFSVNTDYSQFAGSDFAVLPPDNAAVFANDFNAFQDWAPIVPVSPPALSFNSDMFSQPAATPFTGWFSDSLAPTNAVTSINPMMQMNWMW